MNSAVRWIWGLIPLLVLGCLLAIYELPGVEQELDQSLIDMDLPEWARLSVDGRDVLVAGEAPSFQARDGLLYRIGELPGIRRVRSVLNVKENSLPFVTVFRKTAESVAVTGSIDEVADRKSLVSELEGGGLDVIANLVVAPGAPGRWRQAIGHAVWSLRRIDVGSVYVFGDIVFVDGVAGSAEIPDLTRQLEETAPAGIRVVANLTSKSSREAIWSAVMDRTTVVLSGAVADPESRRFLFSRAWEEHGDKVIIDRMIPHGQVPRHWPQAAKILLEYTSRLWTGELTLNRYRATIEGLALSSAASADIAAIVSRTMPKEYALAVKIGIVPPGKPLTGSACQENLDEIVQRRPVGFAPGGSEVSYRSYQSLDKIVHTLARCRTVAVEVQGHSDASAPDSEVKALSLRRAQAVMRYLADGGIAPERMTAAGHGSENPIAANSTSLGRSRNRRIEFKIATGE